jgi:hypothetical protein
MVVHDLIITMPVYDMVVIGNRNTAKLERTQALEAIAKGR